MYGLASMPRFNMGFANPYFQSAKCHGKKSLNNTVMYVIRFHEFDSKLNKQGTPKCVCLSMICLIKIFN
jgi:hypothetical protein